MAEDTGSVAAVIDGEAKRIKLRHSPSGDIIHSLSFEEALALGHALIGAAIKGARKFR